MISLYTLGAAALAGLLLYTSSAPHAENLSPWEHAQAIKKKEQGAGCYELHRPPLRRDAAQPQAAMQRDQSDPSKALCLTLARERKRALFKTVRDDTRNWADACLALNRHYGLDPLPALCTRGGVDLASKLFDSTSWVCAKTVCRNTKSPDWQTPPTTPSPGHDCLSDGWGGWACP